MEQQQQTEDGGILSRTRPSSISPSAIKHQKTLLHRQKTLLIRGIGGMPERHLRHQPPRLGQTEHSPHILCHKSIIVLQRSTQPLTGKQQPQHHLMHSRSMLRICRNIAGIERKRPLQLINHRIILVEKQSPGTRCKAAFNLPTALLKSLLRHNPPDSFAHLVPKSPVRHPAQQHNPCRLRIECRRHIHKRLTHKFLHPILRHPDKGIKPVARASQAQ